SQKSGNTVVAMAFGTGADKAAAEMGHHGAQEVHVIKDASLDAYNPELFAAALTLVLEKVQPQILLASATSTAKDLFPKIAARLKTGIASDCTELTITGDNVMAKKPMYSGKAFATASFENSPLKIVLMRANQLPVAAADASKT